MASPRIRASPATPRAGRSPGSRAVEASTPANGGSVSKDEAIWRRLREAGFDEETVAKRDKASLVAYITKLESELYDYQYNMGLFILEKKEWTAKYEQVKASADLAEITYRRDQAAHASALAEAKKQEEALKRALAIEKECVSNLEKTVHEMRAESADIKLAYENKLAEAREMMDIAQKKFEEAECKLHSAESLHAEASRCRSTASIDLQDIEAREDELRRRVISFESECEAKEKELSLQRQSLYDSQRLSHQEHERLLVGQTLLNQREDYIFQRSKELSHLEKELDATKSRLEEESRTLNAKKSNLDLDIAALATREEAVIERETQLDRRERELLILQEKISSKEFDEFQRLAAEHETSLERRRQEFDTELEERRKLLEDEMEARKTLFEDRESELIGREMLIKEKENSIEVQLKELSEKQVVLANKLQLLDEKEQNLHFLEEKANLEMSTVQNEREELNKMQAELEKIKSSIEDQRKAISHEQEKLELSFHERNELLVLETKLKEEIDTFRSKRMDLDAEADKLKTEKEKFETEWELIDEKREELRNEKERVAAEREAICTYLKNEYDSIKLEKENLRNHFKTEAESLSREREEFLTKMEHEHSDWLIKIQRERQDFVKDINIQRKELENCIEKRREEVETYLREKEEAFEQEKVKELQDIHSQKEMIAKQLEHVSSELKRLENERMEIASDREQREREWSEIKSSIDVLNIQREKLQKQRELLHKDREEIYQKIQHLNKLEYLEIESENRAMSEPRSCQVQLRKSNASIKRCVNTNVRPPNIDAEHQQNFCGDGGSASELIPDKPSGNASPPLSATVSLVKKYARAIFRRSPEKDSERNVESRTSSKLAASPGKEDGSPKLNSFDKMAKDGRRLSISNLGYVDDTAVITGKLRSDAGETTERIKTLTLTSVLEETDMSNVPSVDTNVEMIPEIEHKNSADKVIVQLKKDGANGIPTGTNMLVNGKKRQSDSSSHDHLDFGLNQKQQKKARKNGSCTMGENTPVSVLDDGRSHDTDSHALVGNVTLLPSTPYIEIRKTQGQVTGSAFLEAGETVHKTPMPATELAVSDHEEGDGCNHIITEEVEEEEENDDDGEGVQSSRLQKIWFFLTT